MNAPGEERVKKWMHWCEACKAFVAHVTGHGVDENAALLTRLREVEGERDREHDALMESQHANEEYQRLLAQAEQRLADAEQVMAEQGEQDLVSGRVFRLTDDLAAQQRERAEQAEQRLAGAMSIAARGPECGHLITDRRALCLKCWSHVVEVERALTPLTPPQPAPKGGTSTFEGIGRGTEEQYGRQV